MSIQGLIVCGAKCDGYIPTASDPLAQRRCPLVDVHERVSGKHTRTCYEPRLIDEEVASNVLRLPGSHTYNQMWGLTDDPECWDSLCLHMD